MKTSINLTREKLPVELSIIFAAKSVISLNYNSDRVEWRVKVFREQQIYCKWFSFSSDISIISLH